MKAANAFSVSDSINSLNQVFLKGCAASGWISVKLQ
jgi:hypothetical protein